MQVQVQQTLPIKIGLFDHGQIAGVRHPRVVDDGVQRRHVVGQRVDLVGIGQVRDAGNMFGGWCGRQRPRDDGGSDARAFGTQDSAAHDHGTQGIGGLWLVVRRKRARPACAQLRQ
ncbi:hypothetical protein D3C71_1367850 [compost metagenome]